MQTKDRCIIEMLEHYPGNDITFLFHILPYICLNVIFWEVGMKLYKEYFRPLANLT